MWLNKSEELSGMKFVLSTVAEGRRLRLITRTEGLISLRVMRKQKFSNCFIIYLNVKKTSASVGIRRNNEQFFFPFAENVSLFLPQVR
jgi:hypothetical protein